MSNFDFLKNINEDLYNIGEKLEEDVIEAPRAVPADATLFLEVLVKDIYRQSKTKLKSDELPFYQKIDFLYRSGVITYIYKGKLQDAYNLRNKIHGNYKNTAEETKIALDLHQRLYYISKKYFRDYCDARHYVDVPDYKKPDNNEIHFENCIICGDKNNDLTSNMCGKCNGMIENANYLMSLKNSFGDDGMFKKEDLLEYGLSESEGISMIMNMTRENLIVKKGDYYSFNNEKYSSYIDYVGQFVRIGILLHKFYRNEISTDEIKNTIEYWRGSKNQKPCMEFYRLVNIKIEHNFEKALLELENIQRSIKKSSISRVLLMEWFSREKTLFMRGTINEAFIVYNEAMIKDYFRYKRKGYDEAKIKKELKITDELLDFWTNQFMGDDFSKMSSEIKKELILKEIRKNKSLRDVLKSCCITGAEFEKLYMMSKNNDDEFYRSFDENYTLKRQKLVIRNLKNNILSKAIRKSKITKSEFMDWYFKGEIEHSEFYIDATGLLMSQYLRARKQGGNKKDILKKLTIPKEIVESWAKHDDLEIFKEFKVKNEKITSNLLKRGLIINALKDDKSKSEAIELAKITPEEFEEIYNTSIREKTDFHIRFDQEYVKNRKRLFVKLLRDNDYYNSIEKCEITHKQFNKWYLQEEAEFMDRKDNCEFYITTTGILMDKYLEARRMGKNRPDAARSIGLSNSNIDRWLRHGEFDLFDEFKTRVKNFHIEFITEAFKNAKTKIDVYKETDISVNTIESYIEKGKSGILEYRKIYHLYENTVIPRQLREFMGEIRNKTLKRALKNVKLSEMELKYYYNLGKNGNRLFSRFYQKYLSIKIKLYVDSILSKKSHKISLKNSNLFSDEYEENEDFINDLILTGRFEIIYDALLQNNTTTSKLSSLTGVSVEELYRWYIKGINGDEKYSEFARIFELTIITPKTMAINRALGLGIPKNKLLKKLKADIGARDFKIWQKYGIIEHNNGPVNLDDVELDREEALDIIRKSEFIRCCHTNEDPDIFNLMKQAARSNAKSIHENSAYLNKEELKNEIIGK